ncbi:hypothetical protein DL96DRAFT_1590281 [Flagelloscypha sp. PMI_526]|nr:hypothetical protein DL96DRAFT_1590281 [Flagelloscypha sp. PMI_526]
MSWPAVYPPRGRSRSRSPGRAAPPYPDFREAWEMYDRERAWAAYDRGGYEYRDRSRSPDIPGRKRRRSPSPYDSRYEPRQRYEGYDGYYDNRRGGRRAPADPYSLEYPASLKQFADWFRHTHPKDAQEEDSADKAAETEAGDGSRPRDGIRARWEKYKKEFAAKQLQSMFDHHRKSPWFSEKYDPDKKFQDMRARVRKEGWQGRIDVFLNDLENGVLDPVYEEPEASPENGVEGEKKDDLNGNVKTDDVDIEPEEEPAGDGSKGGDRRGGRQDEPSVTVEPEGNQVMIRTIPPDIGRVKLEGACRDVPGFVYLALGDPMQKRNYYRSGWIKFDETVELNKVVNDLTDKKIEGFKLQVAANNRPFTSRIRFAPEVASRPSRIEKDLESAKALSQLLFEEAAVLRKRKFRRAEPPLPQMLEDDAMKEDGLGRDDAANAAAAAPVPAEPLLSEDIAVDDEEDDSEPEPREDPVGAIERRLEAVLERLEADGKLDRNDEQSYGEKKTMIELDLYIAYLRVAFNTCYYCVVVTDHLEELQRKCIKHQRKPLSAPMLEELKAEKAAATTVQENEDNMDVGVEEAEKEKVDEEAKEEEPASATEPGMDVDSETKSKVEGDEQTASVAGDVPSGGQGSGDRRRGRGGRDRFDPRRNDDRWLEWLDSKLALLLNKDGLDPRTYGGKSYDDELTKAIEAYVKQEDEGKFRCKTCTKLFKAMSFIEKHIINKHPELVKNLDDIPFFNNFALDPHHIQPMSHPPQGLGGGRGGYGDHSRGYDDYARNNPYGSGTGGYYTGNYWDYYSNSSGYSGGGGYGGRDSRGTGGRLGDRIAGYAPPGLDSALNSGAGGRRGGGANNRALGPPPPPPDAKEDPRANAGRRVSYHDMDSVAEGDVELSY